MASTTSKIVWLRWSLVDMGVYLFCPTPMYCDNKNDIQIAHNSIFHEMTKHIEIDCHLTHHHLHHNTLTLSFVPFFSTDCKYVYQVTHFLVFSF